MGAQLEPHHGDGVAMTRPMTNSTPSLRLGMVAIVAVSLFAALFARLWYLQVMAAPEYQVAAEAIQQRVIVEEAPRGRVFDRNGNVLVDNRISVVITVDRRLLRELGDAQRDAILRRLADELTRYGRPTTIDDIGTRLADVRYSPYTPVPVAEDVPEELQVYLKEHHDDFSDAVAVEARAIRSYPYGQTAAHVLGYVGAITEDELRDRQNTRKPYQLGDEIGKSGIERTFEDDLRGVPGRRVLEVDAQGDTVRQLSYRPPVRGSDVALTLDLQVQAVAETALREELERTRGRTVSNGPKNPAPAGSVVVLDPNTGAVIALASYPTFDASQFTDAIDSNEWAVLNDPVNHYPLLNRAIQGEYAPGSTFKLVTSYAGLASGAVTPGTTIQDGGSYRLPSCRGETCLFRNSGSVAHGSVDLRRALTVSSDVYYYMLGARFWFERDVFGDPIQAAAKAFGLGADTGIALPSEHDGLVPTPELKAQRNAENPDAFPDGTWRAGDNVNIAIGQGDMLLTPLQLANAYGTFANGGTLWSPNIVSEVRDSATGEVQRRIEPRALSTVPLPGDMRQAILDGLVGVTTRDGGTARGTFLGFPDGFTVAGKTGTAQTSSFDNALFVGFGPADAPGYVTAAVLEQAGFGAVAAAPVVRRILEPIADPTLMPAVGPGGTLSFPVPEGSDPHAAGEVRD
jgi:penicillin-binding protein 2